MDETTFAGLYQFGFWVFAATMVAGALGVVFHRSIVYSALMLLITFLSIAAVFVLLNAPFIAAAQVLVYAVGLTIVLIFGIMLTGDKPFVDPVGQERPNRFWLMPAVASTIFLGFLIWALLYPTMGFSGINGIFVSLMDPATNPATLPSVQAISTDGGITVIGQLLFSRYLIPFEVASILLLLAMMGAILLSKRTFPEEEGETLATVETIEPYAPQVNIEGNTPSLSSSHSEVEEKETLGVH